LSSKQLSSRTIAVQTAHVSAVSITHHACNRADYFIQFGCVLQVYLILDEFILGGEFEETSKKVRKPHSKRATAAARGDSSSSVQCCASAGAMVE
jgi:hypothetical protein